MLGGTHLRIEGEELSREALHGAYVVVTLYPLDLHHLQIHLVQYLTDEKYLEEETTI